jgi:two-component sensor histidine kinase
LEARGAQMEEPGPRASQEPASVPDAKALQAQLAAARQELAEAERDREHGRDREALLRNELQHQVRNMLAIIRSIFSRTVASGGSAEDLADHFQGRLDAISRYQVARAHAPSGTVDLEQILRDELQSFQFGDDPTIEISGPRVRLRHDVAQVMALALHELVTNSIKFGVLAAVDDRGRLNTHWSLVGGMLHFSWAETGVPVVMSAPVRRGFGRSFLEEGLPYQIGAATRFELRPGGVLCEIEVPMSPRPSAGDRAPLAENPTMDGPPK